MTSLDLDEIHVVTRRRASVDAAEIDALEASLGAPLPAGYRAYLERFGAGAFCGLLWVKRPACVVEQRDELQRALESARWRNADELPPIGRLYPLATSMDGDHIAGDLGDPQRLIVVPHHRDRLVRVASFEAALAWFARSGACWTPTPRPWFAAEIDRASRALAFDECRLDDAQDALAAGAADLGAEVVTDDRGRPSLLFARDVDGVLEIFPDAVRVTVDRASLAFVARVAQLLGDHDIDIAVRD